MVVTIVTSIHTLIDINTNIIENYVIIVLNIYIYIYLFTKMYLIKLFRFYLSNSYLDVTLFELICIKNI